MTEDIVLLVSDGEIVAHVVGPFNSVKAALTERKILTASVRPGMKIGLPVLRDTSSLKEGESPMPQIGD
jgi:hypothetical protein